MTENCFRTQQGQCSTHDSLLLPKSFCFSPLFCTKTPTHLHPSKFIISQSIKASQVSIMTHCSEIEGHWWPGLIVSDPCLLGRTESLVIYIRLIPAAAFVSTLVTKERCARWFFSQRLFDLIQPRYQQKRDIITVCLGAQWHIWKRHCGGRTKSLGECVHAFD